MQRLLNFSTHPGEPELFDDDWDKAAAYLEKWGFDGFELYPVGQYPFERIPGSLVASMHLRFFVFLLEFWRQDNKALLELFANMDNVRHFYGGDKPEVVVEAYRQQLALAHRFGCSHVVFHLSHCELDHIYDWQFEHDWREAMDVYAELLNEVLADSPYQGLVLFENLWWPSGLSLRSPQEYEYLRSKIRYEHCGIVLDTGHLLSSNGGFDEEQAAVSWLLDKVSSLGGLRQEIRAVHLTCSLTGSYIRKTKNMKNPIRHLPFWEQLEEARKHAERIDTHDAFTSPAICGLFDLITPESVIFEFSFNDLATWERKIRAQKTALEGVLWA